MSDGACAVSAVEAWFASRGWTPFPFQRATWQAYLDGGSGLIHSPTGTGKTLGVWLGPVLEAIAAGEVDGEPPPLRVLWITPLRALSVDTTQALRDAVDALGVPWTVGVRTGDTGSAERARQQKRLPTALVTTPESLSVMLSYPDAAKLLRTVRCVVVDEWHELLSTKRGTQTELALARIRRFAPGVRVWGVSATLANLDEALHTLTGVATKAESHLIRGDAVRDIRVETLLPDAVERFPWAGHMGMQQLPRVLEAIESAASTLFFTNTRSQAERWFAAILDARPEWGEVVAIHHGSLDRGARTAVEDALRSGLLRCVVCTSSLDLGVDFSPVDQVIQLGSPKGVARLLQRAGRSGHQPGGVARLLGVPTHGVELVEFAGARDAIARGEIEPRAPLERPLDVLVQHLVTVAAGGGFVEEELLAEVRSTRAYRDLTDAEWRWALDFVVRGGSALTAYPQYRRVEEKDGRWVVSGRDIARRHRLSIGTITSDAAMEVRFLRGQRLGTIEESFIARLRPGESFMFAGRVLTLQRVRDMTAYVRVAAARTGSVPRWQGGRMPLSSELADAVLRRFARAAEDCWEGPEMERARPLLELQRRVSRLPVPDELLVERVRSREGHHWFVFPFAGRLAHEGISTLAAWRIARDEPRSVSVAVNDYGFELLSRTPLELDADAWRRLLSPDGLADDLGLALNAAQLDRHRFREIARVAGLVFEGFPGRRKDARQLQASAGLFYDVFRNHDPGNLLVEQARREVLESQLQVSRLRAALERAARLDVCVVPLRRFSPLAFPIWVSRIQVSLSTERWIDRVQRMALELERSAGA